MRRATSIQQRYDSGSLFAPALPPGGAPPAEPALLAPADGAGPLEGEVALRWTPVADATDYLYQTSESPSFEDAETKVTPDAQAVYARRNQSVFESSEITVYWRVRARRGAFTSDWSPARSFTYALPLIVPDMFVVEVVGPGGADPCGEDAGSRQGCPPPGSPLIPTAPGNVVYQSFNGTGAYALGVNGRGGSELSLGAFSPQDYELRVVPEAEGSFAYYLSTPGRITRVPIQIWDIGTVTPGQPNDPADDVDSCRPCSPTSAATPRTSARSGSTAPRPSTALATRAPRPSGSTPTTPSTTTTPGRRRPRPSSAPMERVRRDRRHRATPTDRPRRRVDRLRPRPAAPA